MPICLVFRSQYTPVKMPIENMEEEGLEKNPNLELAQIKFLLSRKEHKNDKQLVAQLMEAITTESESQFNLKEIFSDSLLLTTFRHGPVL